MATDDFRLFAFVVADLRRAHSLLHGGDVQPASWRLVLGFFSPRYAPVFLFRLAHWLHLRRLSPLAKLVSMLNFTLFGLEIAPRCRIGKGLFFPHTQGTVIGAESIGENATVYHNVTLGARELDFAYSEGSRPVVGRDVLIAAGAVVIGGVAIGDGARIGTNALVVSNIPPGALVRAPKGEVIQRTPDQEDR
jgi:serine O-acetyltransferase